MIYILKKRTNNEWNKSYIDHLNVIENIRREIVQSSSGVLDQTKFIDIINRISKVRLIHCSFVSNIVQDKTDFLFVYLCI